MYVYIYKYIRTYRTHRIALPIHASASVALGERLLYILTRAVPAPAASPLFVSLLHTTLCMSLSF